MGQESCAQKYATKLFKRAMWVCVWKGVGGQNSNVNKTVLILSQPFAPAICNLLLVSHYGASKKYFIAGKPFTHAYVYVGRSDECVCLVFRHTHTWTGNWSWGWKWKRTLEAGSQILWLSGDCICCDFAVDSRVNLPAPSHFPTPNTIILYVYICISTWGVRVGRQTLFNIPSQWYGKLSG